MVFARSAALSIARRSLASAASSTAAPASSASTASSSFSNVASSGLSPSGQAFFGSLCVTTFGLGCWQTRRYFEKIEQVALREEGLSADPVPLEAGAVASPSSSSEKKEGEGGAARRSFRRVSVRGRFRHSDEVLVGPRGPPPGALASSGPSSGRSSGGMSSGPQGYFVLTPLVRSDGADGAGGAVIVNRGWVPMHLVKRQSRGAGNLAKKQGSKEEEGTMEWSRPQGEVEILGVPTEAEKPRFMSPPHPDPKRLLWMDRSALEAGTNTEGSSPVLVIETTSDDDRSGGAFPATPNTSAVAEFKVTPPVHAGYAATWFGLSGAGIIMTKKLMTRGRG